jgi:hypothetical protein
MELRRLLVLLCILLLTATTTVVSGGTANMVPQQSQPEADSTVTRIELSENGTARWTVQIRTRLDTENQTEQYSTFQSQFRRNRSQYLSPFRNRITGVVANAANTTGREMRAENVTATTRIQQVPRQWGIVEYTFVWTNFASTDGDALAVGDVFGSGFFIGSDDMLVIVGPSGYAVESVSPDPASQDAKRVSWDGSKQFGDGRPQVRFAPADQGAETTAGAAPAPDDNGQGPPLAVPSTVLLAGFVGLGMAGAVGAFYVLRTRNGSEGDTAKTNESSDSDVSGSADADTPDDSTSQPQPQDELLTREDKVLRLLNERGGRVRQSTITEELGWSGSKTSRAVSTLAEEGEVEKLRIGRENVISLSENESEEE